MKDEETIREMLERIEGNIERAEGHDFSHRKGQMNILEWVLED